MQLVTNSLVEKSLTDVSFFADSLNIGISFDPGSISFHVPNNILTETTAKIPTKKNKNKLTTVYENEAEAFPSTM